MLQRVANFNFIHWPFELNRLGALAQRVEGEYYQVNFAGFNQPSMPKPDAELLAAAKTLPTGDVQNIIEHGEPVGGVDPFKKPRNQRVYYGEVRLPTGSP